jgi:uncharacterized membrane protein
MTPLTPEFLASCPVEEGFRMRGLEMTRIEVFVDAAFAFALTMLVISFDSIPTNYEEVLVAVKSIPAFVVAVMQLVWIWYTHNRWSRRYGLDDGWTVVLSTALLIVVLVYIYPMRILAEGMFTWFTQGYLPSGFILRSWEQLAGVLVFLGSGWVVLCCVYVLMYRYAARLREPLRLNEAELFETHTLAGLWAGAAVIGILAISLALLLPAAWSPFTGFTYLLLAAWFPGYRYLRYR